MPEWGHEPAADALRTASYVNVRDALSAERLLELAPDVDVRVVPDTAFGIGRLISASREQSGSLLEELGIHGRYAIVQPSPWLRSDASRIASLAQDLNSRGTTVVELPIGPMGFEAPGALGVDLDGVSPPTWPKPLVIAELIAGAELAVGLSLHLAIVATASGVPVLRPQVEEITKYVALDAAPGIGEWRRGDDAPLVPPESDPAAAEFVAAQAAILDEHWDRIAELATA